jgi:hypothetical protein
MEVISLFNVFLDLSVAFGELLFYFVDLLVDVCDLAWFLFLGQEGASGKVVRFWLLTMFSELILIPLLVKIILMRNKRFRCFLRLVQARMGMHPQKAW